MMSQRINGGINIPNFHLEYSLKFKEEKHIQKLTSSFNLFTMLSMIQTNSELIAINIEENFKEDFFKRWGTNMMEDEFFHFLQTEPIHSIYKKKKSVGYTSNVFQSMKNYNLPEWIYDSNQTHVSIGCALTFTASFR